MFNKEFYLISLKILTNTNGSLNISFFVLYKVCSLIQYIVRLSNAERTSELLNATYERPDTKTHIVRAAMNRWREAGWKTAGTND